MSKEQIGFTEHNYDPLNNAIEDLLERKESNLLGCLQRYLH